MKCTCPKCQGNIELDLPEVTKEGISVSCPLCKAVLTVHSESFGARALRKSGEISCASCGNELGPQMHCETCGTPFPTYLVTCLGRKKGLKKSAKLKIKSSPFKKQSKASSQLPTLDDAMAEAISKPRIVAGKSYSKNVVIAVTVIVLLALVAAGTGFYSKKKTDTAYAKNFAGATYGMLVGVTKSRTICLDMATKWQASIEAGKPMAPRPGSADEKDLQAIRSKLDSIKAKFPQEPKKFKNCNQKLARMEAAYMKMQSLALLPGTSLPAFTDSIDNIDMEYKQATKELKSDLPAELMAELQKASMIYPDLKSLLQ
jgi:hypothetical protein